MEKKMGELWVDIYGFDGKYQISNFGRVRSLTRSDYKQQTNWKGYKIVTLFGDGFRKTIGVHRLVALHFIPNPGQLDQVNHKDGDKKNNRVENLEWCTNRENQRHAVKMGLTVPHNERAVLCISPDGSKRVFKSATEAGRILGINPGSISTICCKSEKYRHTAGGYKWEFA